MPCFLRHCFSLQHGRRLRRHGSRGAPGDGGLDVLVDVEEIVRVILGLELGQTGIVRPEGVFNPGLVVRVLEVEVAARFGEFWRAVQ